MAARNLLMIVVDQFRADLLHGALARAVPTPNLDRLAEQSSVYRNHHTVAVPCGPSRASLLTGQYGSNHKSMTNGTPLRAHHPTLASELRKIGREPLLFGYTDTQPDPAGRAPLDPAHRSYTAAMPGFTEVLEMREEAWAWLAHLRAQGYDVPDSETPEFDRLYRPQTGALGGPALYDASHSDTAFLTDQVIAHLDVRKSHPWSALVTYIRPHPPFVAPAPYHALIDPSSIPAPRPQPCDHPFFDAYHAEPRHAGMFWGFDGDHSHLTPEVIAQVRATYLGLVAEVDHHIGRLLDWLDSTGQAEETLLVLTADHGEMLGDFGLWGKQTPFRAASHIPLMIRAPEADPQIIEHPTQSIDLTPSVLAHFGATIPASMDGQLLSSPPRAAKTELHLTQNVRAIALETVDSRLVYFSNEMAPLLFDLSANETISYTASEREAMCARLLRRTLADY